MTGPTPPASYCPASPSSPTRQRRSEARWLSPARCKATVSFSGSTKRPLQAARSHRGVRNLARPIWRRAAGAGRQHRGAARRQDIACPIGSHREPSRRFGRSHVIGGCGCGARQCHRGPQHGQRQRGRDRSKTPLGKHGRRRQRRNRHRSAGRRDCKPWKQCDLPQRRQLRL